MAIAIPDPEIVDGLVLQVLSINIFLKQLL